VAREITVAPDGPFVLVLVLTVVAGFVDAFSLVALTGTFIANQTGNTVLIGIGLGQGHLGDVWPLAVAIGAFVAGAVLSPLLGIRATGGRQRARLLAVEVVLVGAYLVTALVAVGNTPVRAKGVGLYFLILLSGAAMGIQTAIVTRARGAGVTTTFMSGMLAEVGHLAGGLMSVRADGRRDREMRLSIVAVAIATYTGGAALGALGAKHSTLWMLGPVVALVVLLAASVVQDRWSDEPA
jgi:uncharacterized membrane protein YoaK (UPF0700 family)